MLKEHTETMTKITDITHKIKEYSEGRINAQELDREFLSYMENSAEYRRENSSTLGEAFENGISDRDLNRYPYYYMSAISKLADDPSIMEDIVRMCLDDDNLTKENKYYIYCQIITFKFVNKEFDTSEIKELLDDLYEDIFNDYLKENMDLCVPIDKSQRNDDLVIILIAQVLGLEHGPTKTLFDRASVLQEKMDKKVFIINTADVLTPNNSVPWFGAMGANYVEKYSDIDALEYNGVDFSFFQCPRTMPDTGIIRIIMQIVQEEKPWCIVSLGTANITADLCSRIVPTLTINLGFSDLAETRCQYQAVGRDICEADRQWMSKHSLPESHYIESLFTFSLKPQTLHLTRKDLGIQEEVPVCIVIGGRLFAEVDDEFVRLVLRLGEAGIHVAFAGYFGTYDDFASRYPKFSDTTYNLGFVEDILAVCECCDIYINPKRAGGGTSIVEAMFKGLPALTLNYGDVARSAGPEFYVTDYDDMYNHAIKLIQDSDYYQEMSDRSKARAALVMDSETEFVRIMNKMWSDKGFF